MGIAEAPVNPASSSGGEGVVARWWRSAVGYQVYIRSFDDTRGDGIGDLAGVRKRLPYLADLGVDIVWITPFYPSPQADHGYDVADYCAVDPTYGSLQDVDDLLTEAHRLGLRVVLDLVPNHTSDQHEWFLDARKGRDAEHRDFYVWRDPAPDGGPPNNWVSHFGGPAWTLDEASGQYYMHLFLPEQPDLNWANDEVRAAFDRILAFWFERGIDGFRIDVAHSLVEDPHLRDNPLIADEPGPDATPQEVFAAYEHRYDLDQPGVLEIFERWNRLASQHDAMLLGEVYLLEPEKLTRYVESGEALDTTFCFPALKVGWDPDAIRDTLQRSVAAGGDGISWPLSSHDDPRAATRFGGGERGARRALAYLTLLCALPGSPFIYQGDELGLENGDLDEYADPITVRNDGATGRDGSRTPMTWEPVAGYGFTTGTPWLDFGRNRHEGSTMAVQDRDPSSHLNRVRRLLRTRRSLPELTDGTPVEWLDLHANVIALRRGRVVVACNVGEHDVDLPLPVAGELVYGSTDGARLTDTTLRLPADAAVYVEAAT
jgi:alpha-glucosidase